MSDVRIIQGDCLEVLKTLEAGSVDSIVTDPPAGIGFMGKDWDSDKGGREEWITWLTQVMAECHRVLKPGAHALVWSIPRTSHWSATAVENAGFEIRDIVTHLFGQGFPKSLDVSKAIDKAAGAEREVIGTRELTGKARVLKGGNFDGGYDGKKMTAEYDVTARATDDAKKWQGWGTALKPAAEFWVLARKPLGEKTVAANVLKHGTGAINIDECRIEGMPPQVTQGVNSNGHGFKVAKTSQPSQPSQLGRFPANLVLSHTEHCTDDQCDIECAIKMLDEQSGTLKSGARKKYEDSTGRMHGGGVGGNSPCEASEGGASRFFFIARHDNKSPACGSEPTLSGAKAERRTTPTTRHTSKSTGTGSTPDDASVIGLESSPTRFLYCAKTSSSERNAGMDDSKNVHPTVKPLKLMRYLCRLVTPPGGTVLDPFMGSGSTGMAAVEEGFGFVGIEREPDYVQIAEKRIYHRFPKMEKQAQP